MLAAAMVGMPIAAAGSFGALAHPRAGRAQQDISLVAVHPSMARHTPQKRFRSHHDGGWPATCPEPMPA
ncbi:MAG TPA: hypothetical protein VFH47_07085 [Candidatus Thermoplasmatota archaeon]|nr:hypothetical protein [Candidatus Thermoplasmatota archaeon]